MSQVQQNPTELINDEAVAQRRVSIEDSEVRFGQPGVWMCHYCTKRFGNEAVFMRHHCEQKKRAQQISSPMGQAAFSYYTTWMKLKKFKAQSMDAFLQSRYYKSMVKFAEMVVAAGVSKPERYINLMVDAGITPDLWCREQCYKMYLEWMDNLEDPLEQVKSSIMCLMDLAEKEGVDYKDVISHLGPQKILSLITQRKLSPWFLLHSGAVKKLLQSLDPELLKSFDRAININVWVDRLQEHQNLRKDITLIINEVDL